MVIDGLAISEIMEPRGSQSLAGEFADMPHSDTWTGPQPYLVSAAAALAAGRPEAAAAALAAADAILERRPADQETAVRLAAEMIRLAAARRTGDLPAAAAAAARAEALVSRVPGGRPAWDRQIRAWVLSGRGAVELWSGHLDEAARILEPAVAAATSSGGEHERVGCLGQLALVEALRGRLHRAAKLATQPTAALTADEQQPPARHPAPAALVALAWVHLERGEPREARGLLKQADAALGVSSDKLIGAVACLIVACGYLAEGRSEAAMQMVARARSGWSVPAWLEQRLSLAQSRACAAAGDIRGALTAAERAGRDTSPEAAVTLAHAWVAAGDGTKARRALAPALAAGSAAPEPVRLQAWLVDAQLSYSSGDSAQGRRSLASALRLAEREQLRLPFAMERGWVAPVLRRDPELARTHPRLLGPSLISPGLAPASQATTAQVAPVIVEQLSEREREVLRYMSRMLTAAETASELYISINTVKSHLKNIYRKLQAPHCRGAVRRARQLGLI
jgi:LuxR family maltose regulon positive regulatory protein